MKKLILLLIVLLAAFLRLYKLDSYPALNADEAAIGYNAYSLIQTGKDEHGNPWPIHFQSFNDYKPGFYFYLVIPFVKVLGLNIWSVRLPNAFLGIASVYLIYLLVIELEGYELRVTSNKDSKSQMTNHSQLAITASLLLAISPWHLHFSRGGWEVNTATFLILLGIVLFLNGIRKKSIFSFAFCVLSFVLSLYTYHSVRIVAPILFFGLILIYWQSIRKNLKPLLLSGIIGFILLLPLLKDLTKSEISSRVTGVGIIADVGPIERTNEERSEHENYTSTSVVLLHNKYINYGLNFIKNWYDHYHGSFLFISGDEIQRNRVPETGQLYIFEIITIVVGLIYILKNYSLFTLRAGGSQEPEANRYSLILYWLLIAPIPAALTFQSPHALRAQNMVIPLTIISAIGLTKIIELIGSFCHFERSQAILDGAKESHSEYSNIQYTIFDILRYSCYLFLITIVLWSFARYLHNYYFHMSKEFPYSSQYGVKELVDYLSTKNRDYKNIVVTNKYDQPYILFLFYSKYPPEIFQKEHILTPRDRYGFSTVDHFSNFIFKSINWDRDKLLYPGSLIIGANDEIPDEANITKKIYGSNDYLYFKVVEN